MSKAITINKPAKAWAAVNPSGEIWGINLSGKSKERFVEHWFSGRYEKDFKPHGWRIVRVAITAAKEAVR